MRHPLKDVLPLKSSKMAFPKTHSLSQKVIRQLSDQDLAHTASCLIAFSTGADSTALVHLLHTLPHPWHLHLHLAHFNHQLRPASKEEERFARQQAKALGIPISCGKPKSHPEKGQSLEEWARGERWRFLQATLKKTGCDYLFLAHHMDDLLETALMRLMEGASPGAIVGLRPIRGRVLRPLIGIRKTELIAYLQAQGHSWREDESNQDTSRLRNKVRKNLLPIVENVAPGGLAPMTRSLETLREEMEDLEWVVAKGLADNTNNKGELNLRTLSQALPPALARRALAWHLSQQGLRPNQSQIRQTFKVLQQTSSPKATGQRKLGFLGPENWELDKLGNLVKKDTKPNKKP